MVKRKQCPVCGSRVTFTLTDDGELRLHSHNRMGELNPIRVCPGSQQIVEQK